MTPLIALTLWTFLTGVPCESRPAIVYKIAKQEGFFKAGSLPARLHNPGSLRYIGQDHAVKGKAGFAAFATDENGWQALEQDIALKRLRGLSLRRGWRYLRGY